MKVNPNNLEELFKAFNSINVLIIGDVMLDAYYWGKVERISPEAPVPIVAIEKKDERMGGAANVALNIKALGANPILCSVIGNDETGRSFLNVVEKNGHSNKGILSLANRKTTQKTRIIGNKHQMLRIDSEEITPLSESDESVFIEHIIACIRENNVDVIIFEDYDKGVITEKVIAEIVDYSNENDILTCVDPKKRNFDAYRNVSLFKPNLKELKEGLNINHDLSDIESIKNAAEELENTLNNEATLVTLSEMGVLIQSKVQGQSFHVKAHKRDITDVSGAGDTVISIASLCLAAKCDLKLLAEIANLGGGLVCESVGVVSINKEELLRESKRLLVS